ncbi:MAG: hypothetical protein ACP5IF_05085 [Conexivisphaera sp.]
MRRRAQASIIAALFVLVALAILAVGFANVLMAQQNYAAQFQQSVQTDQMRSAESLTITGYSYSNGVYTIYVRNNAPFTSYILRAYYYTSSTFGWSWVNESVGPGAIVAINISTGPLQSPSFAIVTALGNVFTYKPAPPLPMPATYTGRIWGGDKYSYAGNTVVRITSGELYYRMWNTTNPSPANASTRYNFPISTRTVIFVIYAGFYPPYTTSTLFTFYPITSSITIGLNTNPSNSSKNLPKGYAMMLTTVNYYNASTITLGSAVGNGKWKNAVTSQTWFPPYNFHAMKLVGNGTSASYVAYLDGVPVVAYQGTSKGLIFSSAFMNNSVYPTLWNIALISAYTNDTITVYNVPAGWKVEVIGTDAIGRPVFLEAINTATAPSTVTINIDNYYAPITGQLAVTP